MSEQIEVRKIGLKTYIYMGIIVVLGILGFILAEAGKSTKAKEILHNLGYKSVKNVQVYSKHKVEDIDTKIQGYKYFVKFINLDNNKECKGFVYEDFKHNVKQDINCE